MGWDVGWWVKTQLQCGFGGRPVTTKGRDDKAIAIDELCHREKQSATHNDTKLQNNVQNKKGGAGTDIQKNKRRRQAAGTLE